VVQGPINQYKRIKAGLQDIIIRCISREVGIQSEKKFDAKVQEIFGTYLSRSQDTQVTSRLKKAFHDSMQEAELTTAFRSAASLANARRKKPRPPRRNRHHRAERMPSDETCVAFERCIFVRNTFIHMEAESSQATTRSMSCPGRLQT